MTLGECLSISKGRKVRIGTDIHSDLLYCGIADEQLMDDMKQIDSGCMECEVAGIYKSEFMNGIIIIYNPTSND